MEIIILILIFILARFLARGLFDKEWRAITQIKIDRIRRERVFWKLMSAKHGTDEIGIRDIYRLYLLRMQESFTRQGNLWMSDFIDVTCTGYDRAVKKLIKKEDAWARFGRLVEEIKIRENLIESFLEKNQLYLSTKEIREIIEDVELKYLGWVGAEVDSKHFSSKYFDLSKDKISGLDVWNKIKRFYSRGMGGSMDPNFLVPMNQAEAAIEDGITELLCKEAADKENAHEFKNALLEWGRLKILFWCTFDFGNVWYNGIQRFWWRMAENVLL